MLIKSITINNFQCYYGENLFEFSSGLNLIIGDNGAGKSKLYDAFYWGLYDKIFDSSIREFRNTNVIKDKIVSDKAKALAVYDEDISTYVEIVFSDTDHEEEIILKRAYSIKKISEDKWNIPNESNLILHKKLWYQNSRLINTDKERVIDEILPSDIKPYMWFQGEQVDSLIDFNDTSTLTNAINVLSDIREFEFMVSVSAKAYKSADDELRKEQRRLSTDSNKSEDLDEEKKRLEIKIARFESELRQHQEGLTYSIEEQEKLHSQIGTAEQFKDLDIQEKELSRKIDYLQEDYKRTSASVNRNLFKRLWAISGTEHLVNLYADKFSSYEQKRMEQKIMNAKENEIKEAMIIKLQSRLPQDVPEPIYVQQMLDAEKCLVCDREAKKDSEPWRKIQELLERESIELNKKKTTLDTNFDFYSELKQLYQNGLTLQGRMRNIYQDIVQVIERVSQLQTEIKHANQRLEKIRKEIRDIVAAHSISVVGASDILNSFFGHQDRILNYNRDIQNCKYGIEETKTRIRVIENEFNNLSKGKVSPTLLEKVKVLEDFEIVAKSTHERVFNRLIERLEKEANIHYHSMTSENKSVHGQIRLVKQPNGNYMPRIQDSEGNEMYQTNDSNIILVKFSVIMAIISAKKSTKATKLYSLISDAPTTKFTENYSIGFCRTISTVYTQSIIMSKDFYFNQVLRDRLFSEVENLGNIYVIESSVPEGNRADRNDLETKISQLHKPKN